MTRGPGRMGSGGWIRGEGPMESRLSLRERVFALAMGAFAACAAQKASVAGSDDSLAKEVVAAPDRTERDRSRDPHRKPAEMLAFFGVRPGMRVAELGAGGGYSTELF